MRPLVSIITPTYNRANLLFYAIKSVLFQNYTNFEHIIVNDGGENVGKIVNFFNDNRIKLINLKKNLGRSGARNVGLEKATGDIICYLDDDVTYLPNHLSTIVDFFVNNPNEISCFTEGYLYVEKVNGMHRKVVCKRKFIEFPNGSNYDSLYYINFIDMNSLAHRKEVLNKIKFNNDLKAYVDWDFALNLYKNYSIKHIPKITFEYRIRVIPDNLSHPYISFNSAYKNTKKIYKLHPITSKYLIEKRKAMLKKIKLINKKIKYIEQRLKSINPDYVILFGLEDGYDLFNPLFSKIVKKINFIYIDSNNKKDSFLGLKYIDYFTLNKLMKDNYDKKYLFLIYDYNYLNILFFKRFFKKHFKNFEYHTLTIAYKIKKNKNFNNILSKINRSKKIAIFGLGLSGKKTYNFLNNFFHGKVKLFIDDNIKGEYKGIKIVSTHEFLKNYQNHIDLVVFGKYQNLNSLLLTNLRIPYLRLDFIY